MSRLWALPIIAWLFSWALTCNAQTLPTLDDRALWNCATISDNRQRLQCFDTVVAHHAKPIRSISTVGELEQNPPPLTRSSPLPQPAALPVATAARPQLRIAGGYGFGVGDHTGSFHVDSGVLNLQSAAGNSGNLVSGQLWLDSWLAEDWTIGLEYVGLRNEGKLSTTLPKGVSILTDPVEASARVKVRADIGFVNVSYRQASGSVHPFIGAGIGIGYGHASAGFSFDNSFLGSLSQVVATKAPIAGIQGFTGVEFDLGRHAYLAIMPRVIVVNGHPIGVDQQYMDFGVNGVLGLRF